MPRATTRDYSKYALGAALLVASTGRAMAGDEIQSSGLLGRIFRMGGGSSSNAPATNPPGSQSAPLPYSSSYGNSLAPAAPSYRPSAPASNFGGLPETPPVSSASGPADRLAPKPRVTSAVTSADPVLTRFALGRSNDGSSFGMFLEIFADGTVVDSEGVHHVRPADLKPIVDAVQSGEVYRLRGHCGAPSTDFIEYVHVVVYERRFGRLQAHAFSYSGNPQGCDHVIRHLHTAVENLQAKLSHQPTPTAAGMIGGSQAQPVATTPAPVNAVPAIPSTSTAGPVIPLSPADPHR